MPNNFRIDGAAYVGKAGSSTNNGTTKDTPKQKLSELQGFSLNYQNAVVGTGQYSETVINPTITTSISYSYLVADGTVVIQCDTFGVSYWDTYRLNYSGFIFLGPTVVLASCSGGPRPIWWKNCVFINCDFQYSGTDSTQGINIHVFEDCIFINCGSVPTTYASAFRNCIFQNTTWSCVSFFLLGEIDSQSTIRLCTYNTGVSMNSSNGDSRYHAAFAPYATGDIYTAAPMPNSIIGSNIRGQVAVGNGTLLSGPDFGTANAGAYTNNISLPPLYNKPEKLDFTLRLESPHLTRGIGPRHLRYESSFYFSTDAAENENIVTGNTKLVGTADGQQVNLVSTSGLTRNSTGGLIVKPNSQGNFIGSVRSGRIRIGDVPIRLTAARYAGGYNMNTDFPGTESGFQSNLPETLNNNVPKYTQGAAGSSGRNPNRLTYQMRWSTLPDPDPNQDADWYLGATWLEFEWNTAPTWNNNPAAPVGNGSPSFDYLNAGNQRVQARWVQVAVRVVNNYYK